MKIVIDRNIRGAESTFGRHADLIFLDGRDIRAEHLQHADALVIRTATQVNKSLLEETPVGFVGTTSIGTDHLDIAWLEQSGIPWANAPGCNADSAAQYTLAMAWLACERLGRSLAGSRVGIIGRGNVGSRVEWLMRMAGAQTVANDPPLADMGEAGLVSLEEALLSDIVCLHTPLTRTGPYPTFRLINESRLAQIPMGALLINSARGDVVHGPALLERIERGRLNAALDVWPDEPLLDPALLDRSVVATPHVAGYSDDGKRNGTRIVYEAFCNWADLQPQQMSEKGLLHPEQRVDSGDRGISQALEAACFVPQHDHALRALASSGNEDIARGFDKLRKEYPPRRDFHGWRLHCDDAETASRLEALQFVVNTGI